MHRYEELRGVAERDYAVFSGGSLELFFRREIAEETRCTRLGGWWDRKGENEIDIVVDNEFEETIEFVEIKRDASRISLSDLKQKTEAFFAKKPNLRSRTVSFAGLSVEDM